MKTKHPFEIINLGHQADHIIPKQFQLFQEYGLNMARLFLLLIRRRERGLISVVNKLNEFKVI